MRALTGTHFFGVNMQNIYDQYAKEYDTWFVQNDQLFSSELDQLRSLMPDFQYGLDIGCGTGLFTSLLGIQHAIEPSNNMANIAKNRGVDVDIARGEKLIEKHIDKCDLVTMTTVDSFVQNIGQVFKNINTYLKKDGFLLITFLNLATPLGQIYENTKHNSPYYDKATFHTHAEILELLENYGLQLVKSASTIYSLDNVFQKSQDDFNGGVFCSILARKIKTII